MDYFIQGNEKRADEIRAEFERLGIDTNHYSIGNDRYLYYSSNGLLYFDDFSDTLLNVFKSHPGYKELGLSVKPMFKVGDWAKDKYITDCVFQITKILDNSYEITEKDGHVTSCLQCDIEDNSRLWSIEDAKDGDVITNGKMIVIFNKLEEPAYKQHIIAHAGLDICGRLQITEDFWRLGVDKAMPANKKQRDLLFSKMKEAGYTWNAEKKELRKIIEPTFKVGDEIFRVARNEYFKIKGIEKDNDTVWYVATRTRIADNDKHVGEIVRINAFYQNEYSIAPKPHYGISNFYAGMPVLVRDYVDEEWRYVQFSHIRDLTHALVFNAGCHDWYQCIPFNADTKHLLGTTDMCDEQYINW